MAAILRNIIEQTMSRDIDGFRDYHVAWKIETTSILDGPFVVINCPGLPSIGSTWLFGNDVDSWVWCTPETQIAPHPDTGTDEPANFWVLTQTFTNRPMWRCQDTNIENPLLEPPRVGGTFVKYVEEKKKDRHGNFIKSTSHELITGPEVEFDSNRPALSIEITSTTLPLATFTSMVDTVNDANLWGLSPRKIKLSNISWRRLLYGVCTFYYIINYEFDVNFKTFDRKIPSTGTRHLSQRIVNKVTSDAPAGQIANSDPVYGPETLLNWWDDVVSGERINFSPPVKLHEIPQAFDKIVDNTGRPTGWHYLDEHGRIAGPAGSGRPNAEIDVEYYPESNFLLLGVPTTF